MNCQGIVDTTPPPQSYSNGVHANYRYAPLASCQRKAVEDSPRGHTMHLLSICSMQRTVAFGIVLLSHATVHTHANASRKDDHAEAE